jgi:hypothetical protein
MVRQGPVAAVTKFNGWEIYRMEINIIFAHELVEIDVFRFKPPLFPFWCEICCYAWVSDRRIELRASSGYKR